jgi:hypothetical protein
MGAKRPSNQRVNPKSLAVLPVPEGIDLEQVAQRCRYVGSPYHKDRPGFAGMPRNRKPAGSICPSELAEDQDTVQRWLREAILAGRTGRWESGGRYPLDVFHREGDIVFQAKLGSPASGEYHGFPLEQWQSVRDLGL